jgi:hypothetical protein
VCLSEVEGLQKGGDNAGSYQTLAPYGNKVTQYHEERRLSNVWVVQNGGNPALMILSQQTLCVRCLHPRRGKKASKLDSRKHPVVDSTVLTSYRFLPTNSILQMPSSACRRAVESRWCRINDLDARDSATLRFASCHGGWVADPVGRVEVSCLLAVGSC